MKCQLCFDSRTWDSKKCSSESQLGGWANPTADWANLTASWANPAVSWANPAVSWANHTDG